MGKEIVLFGTENLKLEVPVTPEQETVWLTQEQMSVLFDTTINYIFELRKRYYFDNRRE